MNETLAGESAPQSHNSGWFLLLGIVYIFAGFIAIGSPLVITLLSFCFLACC